MRLRRLIQAWQSLRRRGDRLSLVVLLLLATLAPGIHRHSGGPSRPCILGRAALQTREVAGCGGSLAGCHEPAGPAPSDRDRGRHHHHDDCPVCKLGSLMALGEVPAARLVERVATSAAPICNTTGIPSTLRRGVEPTRGPPSRSIA
jgi:hypothetical protein